MKNVTLTKIKKDVLANGGTYSKSKDRLNGQDAYWINDKFLTKSQVIEAYKHGAL